jgi:hypothetical protein
MPLVRILPVVLSIVLLCGCAAATQSSSTGQGTEPDCSFRSATTCWTLRDRFPQRPPEPAAPTPDELPKRPPVVLASRADAARNSP